LQGYRVPLLTGTREDDLAGAVTYYFNPRQEVQRITFRGTTGNANRLIQYLAAQFGFCHRPTNDPGLFLYVVPEEGSRGGVKSYLWIRPQRVLAGRRAARAIRVGPRDRASHGGADGPIARSIPGVRRSTNPLGRPFGLPPMNPRSLTGVMARAAGVGIGPRRQGGLRRKQRPHQTLSREYSRAKARVGASEARCGSGIRRSRTRVPYRSIH